MIELRAGIVIGGATCMHCGLAAARCACRAHDRRGPRHGTAETRFAATSGPQRA